jgi:hypothetical protein
MGLRLIVRHYDRSEALVMSAALDAAGVPNFMHGFEMNSINPFHEVAYGGFCIMVCDQDFDVALRVLEEARRKPLLEGERLSTHSFMIASMLLVLLGGLILPLKLRRWHDVSDRRR